MISAAAQRCWQDYLTGLAVRPTGAVVAAHAGGPEITDHLIDLYPAGVKRAGSGLVEDYLAAGDTLPQVGDHWIALGADGQPRCLLHIDRVEIHRFKDVPERIAIAEGEDDPRSTRGGRSTLSVMRRTCGRGVSATWTRRRSPPGTAAALVDS